MSGINAINSVRNKTAVFIGVLKKYARFVGPGLMVSVAYMDPGNYSTAVAAGSAYKYNLLFLILLSNCLAIFLQSLASKLGAVTGLDLAANCRANLSPRMNIIIYILAEIAIIATDLAEVVGTAISLNILFGLPLIVGVVLTVVDVLIVLMAYRPNGPLLFLRIFELFVSLLVAATVICFGIELYQVSHDSTINFSTIEVLKGFLPNSSVVDMSERNGGNGLFLSLAILGATVMPHSLYLGSGLVQARLKDFDIKNGYYRNEMTLEFSENNDHDHDNDNDDSNSSDQVVARDGDQGEYQEPINKNTDSDSYYRPSIHAIKDTLTYTLVELVISLFTVALFVNAAILIVAGATLNQSYENDRRDGYESASDDDDDDHFESADLFTIYNLLSTHLSPTAGFLFALALLFSGQSAGIVCTLAGQMILEGFLLWSLPPVTRRLITRGLAIVPCLGVALFAGREGLARILNGSQVILSLLLPFVSAPLVIFTCSKKIMRVPLFEYDMGEADIVFDEADTFMTSEELLQPLNSTDPCPFKSTQPAIKLQDLRNAYPCSGWDEEDFNPSEEQDRLVPHKTVNLSSNDSMEYGRQRSRSVNSSSTVVNPEVNKNRLVGFKDLSNGRVTSIVAVLTWGFITCLNIFLIGSWLLGYEVPF